MGKWSIPFRITGEDGKNGADGRVIEFIYRLLPNYDTYLVLRDFLNKPENKGLGKWSPNRHANLSSPELSQL